MADFRQQAEKFTAELRKALGERMRAAVLFGSAARGEATAGVSDVNVLLALEPVDAGALRDASPLARRWVKAGNTPPLVLGLEEFDTAVDAFAVEFSDMLEAREVLHGDDPLSRCQVETSELRLQVEREVRGKVVQLREGLLLAADAKERIGTLLGTALPSFTTYQRALIRLAGGTVPRRSEEVIEAAARLVGGDGAPFLRVWEARTKKQALKVAIDDPVVQGYYALAEQTAKFVDTVTERDE